MKEGVTVLESGGTVQARLQASRFSPRPHMQLKL